MAGTFFNYFDGYIRVEFKHARHGDVAFALHFHGDATASTPCDDDFVKGEPRVDVAPDLSVPAFTSSSMSRFFYSLVKWLEAVIIGVQECAFEWDGEGPMGELRWFNGRDSGHLEFNWSGRREQIAVKHRLQLNKVQMVRAFYESFREFVGSNRYNPLQYEDLNVGEAIALVLEGGDVDVLAAAISECALLPACRLLDAALRLVRDDDAEWPQCVSIEALRLRADAATTESLAANEIGGWFDDAWDHWSHQQRKAYVISKIFRGGPGLRGGEKLRELRSVIVEGWLAEQSTKPQKDGATSS